MNRTAARSHEPARNALKWWAGQDSNLQPDRYEGSGCGFRASDPSKQIQDIAGRRPRLARPSGQIAGQKRGRLYGGRLG